MIAKKFRICAVFSIAFAVAIMLAPHCFSQGFDAGDFIDPGTVGDVNSGADDGGSVTNGGNANGGSSNDLGTSSGGGGGGGGQIDGFRELDLAGQEVQFDNTRRQPFVGVTADGLGNNPGNDSLGLGFVGPNADGNTSNGAGGATGRNLAGGRGGTQGGQGFGQGQNQNVIIRQNVRSRVRPNFQTRPISSQYISSQFQNQLQQLPVTQPFSQGVQIQVQNRTAIISGFVRNSAEADQIERQLRLQPGVYRIENRLSVGN